MILHGAENFSSLRIVRPRTPGSLAVRCHERPPRHSCRALFGATFVVVSPSFLLLLAAVRRWPIYCRTQVGLPGQERISPGHVIYPRKMLKDLSEAHSNLQKGSRVAGRPPATRTLRAERQRTC